MSRHAIVWLIPVLLTLHNAEEALACHAYMPRLQTLLPEPLARLASALPCSALLRALVIISALAFAIAAIAALITSRRALWALLVLEAAVGINVVAHMVSAIVVFHGYGPGLATALLVNAPFAVYCFRRAQREQWLSGSALRATVPAAVVLHGPVLLGGLWLAARAWR